MTEDQAKDEAFRMYDFLLGIVLTKDLDLIQSGLVALDKRMRELGWMPQTK